MTLSNTPNKAPSAQQWSSNRLLSTATEKQPRFLRAKWDTASVESFGPWRMAPPLDPSSNLEIQTPQLDGAPIALPSEDLSCVQAGDPALALEGSQPDRESINAHDLGDSQRFTQAQFSTALTEVQTQAYEKGLAEGREQALHEVSDLRSQERAILRGLSIELHAMAENPDRYFEPLRRLALHLAEQLVRAELSISEHAISQLVRQCLVQLEPPGESAVVTLHPDDLELIQESSTELAQSVHFEGDSRLLRGSVQVRREDARVDDLIEDRLQSLVEQLQINPKRWRERSILLSPQKGNHD